MTSKVNMNMGVAFCFPTNQCKTRQKTAVHKQLCTII